MSQAASNVVHAFPPAPSLHAGLLERLSVLVNEGDLPPGARVPERELCTRISCGGSYRGTSR